LLPPWHAGGAEICALALQGVLFFAAAAAWPEGGLGVRWGALRRGLKGRPVARAGISGALGTPAPPPGTVLEAAGLRKSYGRVTHRLSSSATFTIDGRGT